MRRTLSILLAVLSLCLISSVLRPAARAEGTAAEGPVIALSEESAHPGEEAVFTVELTRNPGLMAIMLELQYDHDLLSLTGTDNGGLGSWSRTGDRVLWLGDKDSEYTGQILTLRFQVSETAAACDIPVTLTYRAGDVTNHAEEDIFPRIEGGVLHIRPEGYETPEIRITALENGELTYSLTAPEGAKLIIACLGTDGRLVSCVIPPAGEERAALPEGTEHVKLFLVDGGTFAPLCVPAAE